MSRDLDSITSIREMPAGLFWTREDDLPRAIAQQQSTILQLMPVHNTTYLHDEGEILMAVPYRHRN